MKERKSKIPKNFLIATLVGIIGYIILLSTNRTGLVDISIESILFFTGSMIAFKGFLKSKKLKSNNFRKFQLFYGITYLTVVISFMMGIYYFIKNPNVIEIGVLDVIGNSWLIFMSSIKSFSMIFLIFTWIYFYKYLNINVSVRKKITVYMIGLLIYLGLSLVIWRIVDDINVLSLGVILGIVIGIFALIALDKRTRYLTIIFTIYSIIHLVEFYIMGIGEDLTNGINNPIYWSVTVLYILEVKRWIDLETNRV